MVLFKALPCSAQKRAPQVIRYILLHYYTPSKVPIAQPYIGKIKLSFCAENASSNVAKTAVIKYRKTYHHL